MEEEKKKKINSNYGILVILLFAMVCTLTDWIIIERKIRVCECPKCESTNNEAISGNNNNTKVNQDNIDNNIQESKGVSEFTVPFDDSRSFNAKIVDGNIHLSFDDQELILETLNAKEMYYMGYHQGGCYLLFFITEDNNLYQISNDLYILFNGTTNIDEHIAIPILLAENVTTFLGNGKIYPANSNQAYGFSCEYVEVLDNNGHATKVFFEQEHYFGGQKKTIVK